MAVRQYIGARYTIKVYENSLDPSSAEWEALTAYEPLTLVTFNNDSYLSKKQVPSSVGDPASNPSYWVLTGSYNGQIATLQNAVNEINDILPFTQRKPRNVILIGDSWATGQAGLYNGWSYYLRPMLTDCDTVYVCEKNGAGFTGYNAQYLTELQAMESGILNKDDIDLILVAGGLNDKGVNTATLETDIQNFCNHIYTYYPNAIILNVAINNLAGYASDSELVDDYLNVYAKFIGDNNKYFFVDKRYTAPITTFVNQNHLNNDGYQEIARVLYSLMYDYDYVPPYSQYPGKQFKNSTLTGTEIGPTVSLRDRKDHIYIYIGGINVGSFTPGGFLTIADFENTDIALPYYENDCSHVALASASIDGGTTHQTFPVLWRFTGKHKISLYVLNLNRGSGITYTNFYVFETSATIPKSTI